VLPSYDAVIVGAGPAGAATARGIAGRGYSVLLLEEHREIGEPLHCSGLVTPRTLALAGVSPEVVLNQIDGALINLPSGRCLAVGGAGPYAVAIDRVRFDRELVAQAGAAGAQLRTGNKLVGIERDGGELMLKLRSRAGEEQVKTRLLVGADGAQSFVARWLGVQSPAQERVVGVSVLARRLEAPSDRVQVFAGNRIAPGFFGWLIPLGDGQVRIGIATNDTGRRPIHYLRDLVNAFPGVFEGAEFGRFFGGVIPLSRVKRPYGDNVLLVGDAAGQVKPTSGGGIYAGLVGATHCGEVAVGALAADDLSGTSLQRYEVAWQKDLGEEFDRMQAIRRVFLSLSDAELERLALLLQAPGLQRLVSRHGDIDFPSAALLRLVVAAPAVRSFMKAGSRNPWVRIIPHASHTSAGLTPDSK
jgi:geranylgeranyl reductase family protein